MLNFHENYLNDLLINYQVIGKKIPENKLFFYWIYIYNKM